MDSSSAEAAAEKDGAAESGGRQPPVTSTPASPTSAVDSPPASDPACMLPADLSSGPAPSQSQATSQQHSDDIPVTFTGGDGAGGDDVGVDDEGGGETDIGGDGVGGDGVGSDGVGGDGVGSDGVGSDGVGSDGVGSDGVGSDGVGGDGVGGDGVGSDGVGSDGVGSDGVGSDGVGSDGVGSDGVGSDGVGGDGVGSDGVGSDGVGSDGVGSDGVGGDGVGSDGVGGGETAIGGDDVGGGETLTATGSDDEGGEDIGGDDVGGAETATGCDVGGDDVGGGETLAAVRTPNPVDGQSSVDPRETVRLQTFSYEDDEQTGDIESLVTSDISASDDPCSSETESSTDDAYVKNNGCGENPALQTTRCVNASEALTCQSEVAPTVCDQSPASADRDHSLSSGDSTEGSTAPEQRISSAVDLEETAASNVDKAPDLSKDHSEDVVPQFHTESVVGKSQKHLLEGEESAVESVSTHELNKIESEGVPATSHVGDSAPRDTDYSHTLMGESQDDSSCGLVIDYDDDEDVITLSEEHFMTSEEVIPSPEDSAPGLVITNVCSVREDGSFILDDDEDTHVTPCENGTDSGSNLPPSPPVHVPSPSVQQAVDPAEGSVAESRSRTRADADGTSALSTHTPDRSTGSTSDAVGYRRSSELLEERTRYQGEHSAQHTRTSRGSTKQQGNKPKSSESLSVKLEQEDAGYDTGPAAIPKNDTRPGAESIDVRTTPGSCSQVASVDSFSRKRPYSEVGTEEENRDKAAKALKQHLMEITSTDGQAMGSNAPVEGHGDSVEASSSHPANLFASRADGVPTQAAHQAQSSEASGTLSKSLMIPSSLSANKGITPSHSAATKKVILTIPPSLGRNKIDGAQLRTHIVTGTSQSMGSQVVSSNKDGVGCTGDKAGESVKGRPRRKARSAPRQELSVPMPDGSVKTFTIVMAGGQQAQQTVSVESVTASSSATEPCMVRRSSAGTSNCCVPVSVKSIIQGKDDKQKNATTSTGKYSLLHPAQPFSVSKGPAVSSEERSAPPVSSAPSITAVAASGMRADPWATASQTPASSARKPAPTTVVFASERTAPRQVVFRTPQASVGTRAAAAAPQQAASSRPAASVGSAANPPGCSAALMPAPAPPPSVSPASLAAAGSKQHIRLDQVSADAKLSANDMAALIEGKNLVPSLEPRLQWGGGGGGGGQSVFRCVECGLLYGTLVGYTAHVKRMSMVVRYACMLCRAALVFFNRCTFLAHLRKHSTCTAAGDQVLNLKSCTMSVSSLQAQLLPQAAAQYMDPMSINRNHPVSCAECQGSFPNASRLATHISAAAHCSFQHTCHHCQMQLPTPCALRAHLRLHHATSHAFCAQPPYVCPECGLQFASQVSLYQHLYATCLHFNRCVSLTCFQCQEWFPTLASLEDHIFLTHPNNRRYKCTVCRRTYNTRLSFAYHIPQMHKLGREEVRFEIVSSCASCCLEKDFVEGRSHARKHVQLEQTQYKVGFSFTCLLCKNFMSPFRSGLVTHLNRKHAAYKFPCSICQQGFVMLSLLRAHVLWAHSSKAAGEARFQCCQCSAASLSGESALPHVMWHVVKRVTDLANPPPTLHVNKHCMDIVVPPGNVKDKQTYFCRSCGSVLLSSLELWQHMKIKNHFVCVKFPTCPYCQRFDFANMYFFWVHTKTCMVECGDTDACYFSDHLERMKRSSSQRDDNGCASGGKDGIEGEVQLVLEFNGMAALSSSPAQSAPQSTENSAAGSAPDSSDQARSPGTAGSDAALGMGVEDDGNTAHSGVSTQAERPPSTCSDAALGVGVEDDRNTAHSGVSTQTERPPSTCPGAARVTVQTSSAKTASRGPVASPESTESQPSTCPGAARVTVQTSSAKAASRGPVASPESTESQPSTCPGAARVTVQTSSAKAASRGPVASPESTESQPSTCPGAARVTVQTSSAKAASRGPVASPESTERSASSSLPGPARLGEEKGTSSGSNPSGQSCRGAAEASAYSSCGPAAAGFPQSRTIVVFTKNGKVVGHTEMEKMCKDGLVSSRKVVKHSVCKQRKTAVDKVVPRPDVVKSPPPSAAQKPATSHGLPWRGNQRFIHVVASSSSVTHMGERKDCGMARGTQEVTPMTPALDSEGAPGQQQLYHPCPLCGLTYASASQLAGHRASVHRGEKTVLSCQLCEKKGKKMMLSRAFLKKHLLRRHKIATPLAESMVYGSCGGWSSALASPEAPATAGTPSAAAAAAAGSKRRSTDSESSVPSSSVGPAPAVKRLRVAQAGEGEGEGEEGQGQGQDYVCAKCRFSCPGRGHFAAHIRSHAVARALQCPECGLCFSAAASLSKHLLMVHKVRRPHAYLARHGITLPDLPPDLSSHMDTLAPLGQPEVVMRTAGPFRESPGRQQASWQDREEQEQEEEERRKRRRAGEGASCLECTVCYKEFETEVTLKAHMRSHGMAFIRSRRALPRQAGEEAGAAATAAAAKDSAGGGGTGDTQPGGEGTS